MAHCVICNQPLPEGQKTLEYFAQEDTDSKGEDDIGGHEGDQDVILTFTATLWEVISFLGNHTEDLSPVDPILTNLAWLRKELVQEAERRNGRIARAGFIWQDRAQAATTGAQKVKACGKKDG